MDNISTKHSLPLWLTLEARQWAGHAVKSCLAPAFDAVCQRDDDPEQLAAAVRLLEGARADLRLAIDATDRVLALIVNPDQPA